MAGEDASDLGLPDDTAPVRQVFPPSDPIAQFVIVIRGQRDDLTEVVTQLTDAAQNDKFTAGYYHRLLVSHYFEAVKWFAHAAKNSEEVMSWLDGFEETKVKEEIGAAVASTKPGGLAKTTLWAGRQTTFHYPRVGVTEDGLEETLEGIGDRPAHLRAVKTENGWYARADFSDELFNSRLLHTFGDDLAAKMEEVRDAAVEYVFLADACYERYMAERELSFGDPLFNDEEGTASERGEDADAGVGSD
jgi:hypothetical protein